MATEFVGIELNLMGYEGVKKDLMELDRLLKSFRGRKQFDAGFSEARKQVVAYKGELEKLQRIQKELAKKGIFSEGLNNKIEETKNKLHDAQQAVREFGQASKDAGKTFMQTFNSWSSRIAHVGSAMQSLGNALTRLSSPFRRFTSGLIMGAGYKALNLFTEGFSGAFERYDTMQNYAKSLKALGLNADQTFKVFSGQEKAMTAIENLNESVLGLPTGLDEIVAMQKVYAGATGEMVKSTKTAIAANNTFLASGMGSREQRFMQKYLVALSSGAELTTNQWQSMARIAPLAMRAVSEELGYASDDYDKFTKAVQDGTISGQKFLDAFIKVGTEGKVQAAANVMKTTWEGLSANIQNATKRMGEGVLKALDEAFMAYNGRNLVQNLLGFDANGKEVGGGIKHWVNNMSDALQNWVKANPELITDFFETLKGVDWGSIARGFAEGALSIAKFVAALAKMAEGKDLSWIGKFMTKASIWGRGLTILGGVIKGLRHPLAFLATLAEFTGKGRLGKLGIFGKLAQLFGKKKDITAAGESAKAIPTVADTFKNAFSKLEGLITAAGAITIVAGTGAIAFGSVKYMINSLKEIIDVAKTIDWGEGAATIELMAAGIAIMIKAFQALGKIGKDGLIAEGIGALSTIFVTGTIAVDMELLKSGVQNFSDMIDLAKGIVDKVNNFGTIDDISGAAEKARNVVDALWELKDAFTGKSGSKMDRGVVQKGIPTFTFFQVSSVQNISKALTHLKSVVDGMNSLATVGLNVNIQSKVHQIAAAVTNIMKELKPLTQPISAPGKLLGNSKNLAFAMKQIYALANRINKLAGIDVNTSGFASFVQQLKDALDSLKDIEGDLELDITVKLSSGFKTSVNTVKNQIKQAKKEIEALSKSSITVRIPVTVRFSVSTNLGSALGIIAAGARRLANAGKGGMTSNYRPTSGPGRATGGTIYRAKGGKVPMFKRIGTDTVPAMLTPGEYVHNKKAVNTFGLDFMRKVNNLDVKGAMSDLMRRAGGMASVNRGTTITNNYHNNQRVVINNNSAGAGFTFRSASRFVGAI